MEMLKIGKSVYVPCDKVLACIEKKSRNSNDMLTIAKENHKYIDATNGKATKTLILLDDGTVVTASVTVETIINRCENKNEK